MLNYVQLLDVCTDYMGGTGIPSQIAFVITMIYRLILIGVPVALIIWGMFDLGKAVMAQKEDEIKKGQNTFIKRLIAACIVFFVVVIVKIVISLFSTEKDSMANCIDELLSCTDISGC